MGYYKDSRQSEHIDPETAENIKLVSVLYTSAVSCLNSAVRCMERGDQVGKEFNIRKAVTIVSELSVSLNMGAGEIAENLRRLYEYVLDRLGEAALDDDYEALEDSLNVLDVLREAWGEIELAAEEASGSWATAKAGYPWV